MNITEIINSNVPYFIMGLVACIFLLLLFSIINTIRYSKLNNKYKKFMTGATGKNLEEQILSRFEDIDKLKSEALLTNQEIQKIEDNLLSTFQKVGVVKYDAFKEMGGKLSFVLVLLDKSNNGILLNSVHSSREGCYTYLKEIIKGESFLELSEDEKEALNQAINCNNYMS